LQSRSDARLLNRTCSVIREGFVVQTLLSAIRTETVCIQIFKTGVSDSDRRVSSLGGEKKKKKRVLQINIIVSVDQRPPARVTVQGGHSLRLPGTRGQAERPRCSSTAPRSLLTGCWALRVGFHYVDSDALPVGSASNDSLEEIPVV